jgi:hypothetical protein
MPCTARASFDPPTHLSNTQHITPSVGPRHGVAAAHSSPFVTKPVATHSSVGAEVALWGQTLPHDLSVVDRHPGCRPRRPARSRSVQRPRDFAPATSFFLKKIIRSSPSPTHTYPCYQKLNSNPLPLCCSPRPFTL